MAVQPDVIVLGAGIAGLGAAERLAASGHRVLVIDHATRCGGTHRSRAIGPYTFDVGSIFYEPNAPLLRLAPDLRELCPTVWREQRRIGPGGEVLHYPIEPRQLLAVSPWRTALGLGDMLVSRATVSTNGSLDAIIRQRLGRTFLKDTGLHSYISRFHHVPPEEIDEAFFRYRMGFIAHMTQPMNLLRKGFVSVFSNKPINAKIRRPQHVRPYDGYDLLFNPIRARLESTGVTFRLGETPVSIERRPDGFRVETDQGEYHAPALVSTIPLDTMHRLLFGTPSGLISLDMTTLFVSAATLSAKLGNVIYNFHQHGWWKRATVYSRIYPEAPTDREFFAVEVTIAEGSRHDPDRAFADFAGHMSALGLATDLRLEGADLIESCYPLYRRGVYQQAATVAARVGETGIITAGRQGRFEYLPTSSGVIRRVWEELQKSGLSDGAPAQAAPST